MRLLVLTCLLVSLTLAYGQNLDSSKTRDNDIHDSITDKQSNNIKRSPNGLSTYTKHRDLRDVTEVDVVPRGTLDVIIKIFTSAITVGAESFSLANIISGGCASYPTICEDQDAIERLEKEMDTLTDRFRELYYKNKWQYVDLSDVEINNRYIMVYLDVILNKVQNSSDLVEEILTLIEADLRNMTDIFKNNDVSDALIHQFVPFDFTFTEIAKMVNETASHQFGLFVANKFAVVLLGMFDDFADFFVTVAKDINELWDPQIKNKVTNFIQLLNLDASEFTSPKAKKHYLKLLKQFKEMATGIVQSEILKDIGKRIHDLDFNLKDALSAPWHKVKGAFVYMKNKAMKKMTSVIDFITHPKASYQKFKKINWKFDKAAALSGVFQAGMSVMTAYYENRQWEKLAEEVKNVREEYEKYNKLLREAVIELENQEKQLGEYWQNVTETFTMLVEHYQNITDHLMNAASYDAFGLKGIDMDKSDPYFHTDFEIKNPKELKSKQEILKNFLKNTESLEILKDKLRFKRTLIQETKNMVGDKSEIDDIYSSLKQIFRNFDSDRDVRYGTELRTLDVVCTVAMSCAALDQYDFYNTTLFRDRKCEIEDFEFEEMKDNAAKKRLKVILYNVVDERVVLDNTIENILDIVKTVYSNDDDPNQQEYGSTLTRKDIVCAIAERVPSRNYYRFYPLNEFRPDCSQVTDEKFREMDEKIVELGDAKDQFTKQTDLCFKKSHPRYCPFCPEHLIWDYHLLDVSDVLPFYEEYGKSVGCTFQLDPCKWICPN